MEITMIQIKKYSELTATDLDLLFNRFGSDFSSVMVETVIPIVNEVKNRGDAAVREYTEKFDGVSLTSITASEKEIEEGYRSVPDELKEALTLAKKNIEEFHSRQKRENTIYTRENGATLGMIYQPIESAAVYAPGGKAAYPSSVLMGVIPARIAGVKNISVITPPMKDGKINAGVLAACRILGITSIVKSGGAQGIAAAGLGTESVKKSHIIVGPGNIYVTAAKTYLFSLGLVQIDSMAGPSEVLVIADSTADPKWTAWDLLSQAEHEERAIAVLVTDSEELARQVNIHIKEDIDSGRGRSAIKKASLESSALTVIVDNIDEAIDFSNRYAPEHMQMLVANPLEHLGKIKNVGSLFLGSHTPVAAGDYFSGTNHILPTGGAARFSSGTSVDTFTRRTTFQHLTSGALKDMSGPIGTISRAEGFDDKHGGSVRVRFE
jgi:histidinol dehydrogenase